MWHAWKTGEVRTEFGGGERPGGKRPKGRPRCRWEENTKMNLEELEWRGIDWIDLGNDYLFKIYQ